MDPHALGKELKLDDKFISKCIKEHPGDTKGQCCALLMEWRETDGVINQGENAPTYLRSLCTSRQQNHVHYDTKIDDRKNHDTQHDDTKEDDTKHDDRKQDDEDVDLGDDRDEMLN